MRGEFFRPGKPFAARYDWDGMLDRFDWLSRLADIPQEPAYHGEGDVLAHTAMVLDQLTGLDSWKELPLEDKHKTFAAALFHDVGKWSCTRMEGGNIVSSKHALKGASFSRITLWKGVTFSCSRGYHRTCTAP